MEICFWYPEVRNGFDELRNLSLAWELLQIKRISQAKHLNSRCPCNVNSLWENSGLDGVVRGGESPCTTLCRTPLPALACLQYGTRSVSLVTSSHSISWFLSFTPVLKKTRCNIIWFCHLKLKHISVTSNITYSNVM